MKLIIKLDGEVIATLEGSEIQHGRRVTPQSTAYAPEWVDDPKIYVQRTDDGKTLWVLNLSANPRMTVEELP